MVLQVLNFIEFQIEIPVCSFYQMERYRKEIETEGRLQGNLEQEVFLLKSLPVFVLLRTR
ncbi:hypothetical protein SDC9_155454 [bioreactor metagenome]|uniref:Uncharacterized protein n=1 Tax=bioreactor metagenome TaxID=1076179 RepID=A0A645F6D9_9ZZZZ